MLPHHPQSRSAVFLEDPQELTDQPLELIKELSKLTNYIISVENYNLTLNEKHFRIEDPLILLTITVRAQAFMRKRMTT